MSFTATLIVKVCLLAGGQCTDLNQASFIGNTGEDLCWRVATMMAEKAPVEGTEGATFSYGCFDPKSDTVKNAFIR